MLIQAHRNPINKYQPRFGLAFRASVPLELEAAQQVSVDQGDIYEVDCPDDCERLIVVLKDWQRKRKAQNQSTVAEQLICRLREVAKKSVTTPNLISGVYVLLDKAHNQPLGILAMSENEMNGRQMTYIEKAPLTPNGVKRVKNVLRGLLYGHFIHRPLSPDEHSLIWYPIDEQVRDSYNRFFGAITGVLPKKVADYGFGLEEWALPIGAVEQFIKDTAQYFNNILCKVDMTD